MGCFQDELNEIKRKSKKVFIKRGIYPFLDDGINNDEGMKSGDIPGFQIFRLWPEIDVIDDKEDECPEKDS